LRDEHWGDSENTHQLYYLKTKRWLKNLINEWEIERSGDIELTSELASLEIILDKLERSVFQIAVFGMVGRGKSSVLNALADQKIFKTGALHGVTQSIESIELTLKNQTAKNQTTAKTAQNLATSIPTFNAVSYSKILTSPSSDQSFPSQTDHHTSDREWQGSIEFFDTPGIDEVNGKEQTALAYRLASQVDLILFVIAGDINQVEYNAIAELQKQGKPLLLVFNKIDQYPELDRLAIYSQISDRRVKDLIAPSEIVMVAAAPVELRGVVSENGNIIRERSQVKPRIEQLEQKITEIIRQKGKPLIVLNNTVAARKIQQKIIKLKINHHDLLANNLITKLICLKAVLIGLNPIAIADLIMGTSLDLGLILALSSLYGASLSSSGAFSVLAAITLGVGAVGAVDLFLHLGLNYLLSTSDILIAVKEYLPEVSACAIGAGQGIIAGISGAVVGQVAKRQFLESLAWGNYQSQQIIQGTISSLQNNTLVSKFKIDLN